MRPPPPTGFGTHPHPPWHDWEQGFFGDRSRAAQGSSERRDLPGRAGDPRLRVQEKSTLTAEALHPMR